MKIKELQKEIHKNAVEHGWWHNEEDGFKIKPEAKFTEFIALTHSELSESLEEHRAGHGLTKVYYNEAKLSKPEGVAIELADAVIRIMDFCEAANIDLGAAIELKHEYNKTRPWRHGKVC